jgi:hypothetical protein
MVLFVDDLTHFRPGFGDSFNVSRRHQICFDCAVPLSSMAPVPLAIERPVIKQRPLSKVVQIIQPRYVRPARLAKPAFIRIYHRDPKGSGERSCPDRKTSQRCGVGSGEYPWQN